MAAESRFAKYGTSDLLDMVQAAYSILNDMAVDSDKATIAFYEIGEVNAEIESRM